MSRSTRTGTRVSRPNVRAAVAAGELVNAAQYAGDVRASLRAMPDVTGKRIRVRFRPLLTANRGKLLSGQQRGTPVHAGSFLRKRLIVLDSELVRTRFRLARILVHELFHFVWTRLSNAARRSYEDLLAAEFRDKVCGELGWSAERLKEHVTPELIRIRARLWRNYVCESFCDTAGWLYSRSPRYAERTLDAAARSARRTWFRTQLARPVAL